MSTTTPQRRQGRPPADESPATRDDILLAALDAFAASGFDAMSVRELNAALGVSHNLVHRRFGSKAALWHAVVERWVGEIEAAVTATLDSAARDADPLEVFHDVVVVFVTANARRPQLARMMTIEASIDGPRLDHLHERFVAPMSARIGALFSQLEADGRVRSLPPSTLFFLLAHGATALAGHRALATKLGDDPAVSGVIDRHARAVADVLVDGLRLDRRDRQ